MWCLHLHNTKRIRPTVSGPRPYINLLTMLVEILKCDVVSCPDSQRTTWRNVGSAHSFAWASRGCGMPCGKILGRYQGTWHPLVTKQQQWNDEKNNSTRQNIFYMSAEKSRRGLGKNTLGLRHQESFLSFNFSNSKPLLFLWPWQRLNLPSQQKQLNSFVSRESSKAKTNWKEKKKDERTFHSSSPWSTSEEEDGLRTPL